MKLLVILSLFLVPLAHYASAQRDPDRVQSKPIVIKLPSPSAVDGSKSSNKGDGDFNAGSEEVKAKPTKVRITTTTEASQVVPATPAAAFRQEVLANSGVAPSSSFLNPVVASGLQPPSISGLSVPSFSAGANGLNAPVPGLLAPQFGSAQGLPAGGQQFPGQASNGILGVLNSLGRQLTGAVGLNGLLPQNSPQAGAGAAPNFPQIRRIPGQAGPPIPGLPNIPGLPIFPGAYQNGQIDLLSLFSGISRRAFNGSSLSDLLPPSQAQKFADNVTDSLLPTTAKIDLSKFMGRWFEGINSPRATDQRCVVHHYGGLTENGKTATYTALKIYREGSEFGQVRYSIGYAFKGGRQDGMLQMHTSEASDPTPYWIYRVGPVGKDPFGNQQYEYAIISNWIKYPVVILVRDPDQFRVQYEEEVLKWLEDNQFINGFVRAFNLVQPADYANCQYADSTFEIFG